MIFNISLLKMNVKITYCVNYIKNGKLYVLSEFVTYFAMSFQNSKPLNLISVLNF